MTFVESDTSDKQNWMKIRRKFVPCKSAFTVLQT